MKQALLATILLIPAFVFAQGITDPSCEYNVDPESDPLCPQYNPGGGGSPGGGISGDGGYQTFRAPMYTCDRVSRCDTDPERMSVGTFEIEKYYGCSDEDGNLTIDGGCRLHVGAMYTIVLQIINPQGRYVAEYKVSWFITERTESGIRGEVDVDQVDFYTY